MDSENITEISFCFTPVSVKEKIFKWSFSFYQRLPTFLLTVADSTVNWGHRWLLGRIIPSSCGISGFWKHKDLAAIQMQVKGNYPERMPQMRTNLGMLFFSLLRNWLYPSHNSHWCMWHLCQVGWVASTQDHSRDKVSRIFKFSYCPIHKGAGRQGNNMEHVGNPYIWIFDCHPQLRK